MRWLILILAFVALPSALGFGVASEYLENSTLRLEEGKTREFVLTIQNPEDQTVAFDVVVNSEHVEILTPTDEFIAGPKSYNNQVKLLVKSDRLDPGDSYDVQYSVGLKPGGEGNVPLQYMITRNFKVMIVDSTGEFPVKEESGHDYRGVLFLLVLIAVLTYFLLKTTKVLQRR